jgi:hypothetical protein
LEAASEKLRTIQNGNREATLKPLMTAESWESRKEKFFAMDEDTFNTMAASIQEVAKKPAQISGLRTGMPEPVAGSGANKNGRFAQISLRD